jgi:hypothetical protein
VYRSIRNVRWLLKTKAIAEYSDAAGLRQIMTNAKRLGKDSVYWEAFSRLCVISGRDESDPLVRDFYSTLTAYEELLTVKNGRKTLANRTRQKLARKGVVHCLQEWAFQKTSAGLELLVSKGLYELTGEYLIVKYADRFSPAAVVSVSKKLSDLGFSPREAPSR